MITSFCPISGACDWCNRCQHVSPHIETKENKVYLENGKHGPKAEGNVQPGRPYRRTDLQCTMFFFEAVKRRSLLIPRHYQAWEGMSIQERRQDDDARLRPSNLQPLVMSEIQAKSDFFPFPIREKRPHPGEKVMLQPMRRNRGANKRRCLGRDGILSILPPSFEPAVLCLELSPKSPISKAAGFFFPAKEISNAD